MDLVSRKGESEKVVAKIQKIGLDHVRVPFIILVAGFLFGFIAFVFEKMRKLWRSFKKKLDKTVNRKFATRSEM